MSNMSKPKRGLKSLILDYITNHPKFTQPELYGVTSEDGKIFLPPAHAKQYVHNYINDFMKKGWVQCTDRTKKPYLYEKIDKARLVNPTEVTFALSNMDNLKTRSMAFELLESILKKGNIAYTPKICLEVLDKLAPLLKTTRGTELYTVLNVLERIFWQIKSGYYPELFKRAKDSEKDIRPLVENASGELAPQEHHEAARAFENIVSPTKENVKVLIRITGKPHYKNISTVVRCIIKKIISESNLKPIILQELYAALNESLDMNTEENLREMIRFTYE